MKVLDGAGIDLLTLDLQSDWLSTALQCLVNQVFGNTLPTLSIWCNFVEDKLES